MIIAPFVAFIAQQLSYAIDIFALEPQQIASHDRSILEEVILPYFAKSTSIQRILFVGCSAYTQWYENIFHGKEYWTIDSKRIKRKYGSEHHIVDSVTNVGSYVAKQYFDVIIMNGVIGYGLNRVSDIERAVDACHAALASQGILLVGWNDTRQRTPIDIRALRAISALRAHYFEPLQACHYRTEGAQRHTFSFYRKA
jgi:hypothetical protein